MAVVMPKLPVHALEGDYQTSFDAGALLHIEGLGEKVPYTIYGDEVSELVAKSQLSPLATALQAKRPEPQEVALIAGEGQWLVFVEQSEPLSTGASA